MNRPRRIFAVTRQGFGAWKEGSRLLPPTHSLAPTKHSTASRWDSPLDAITLDSAQDLLRWHRSTQRIVMLMLKPTRSDVMNENL
ncbi:hypothetical protein MFRU_009g00530 [Monilinia fructicola]|nr:hypothetical protein MFRU_009g00530 [Monilinia fructicola]